MPHTHTLGELIDLAIALEHANESFYRGLAALFPHEPDAAAFWNKYADEEAGHARWVEKLRGSQSKLKLDKHVDVSLVRAAQRLLRTSPADLLKQVATLEDAYQLAVEFENSETNTIFDFLISDYALTDQSGEFLRAQLKSHISRLNDDFPARFRSQITRSAVTAKKK
jgi:hypothetical protein